MIKYRENKDEKYGSKLLKEQFESLNKIKNFYIDELKSAHSYRYNHFQHTLNQCYPADGSIEYEREDNLDLKFSKIDQRVKNKQQIIEYIKSENFQLPPKIAKILYWHLIIAILNSSFGDKCKIYLRDREAHQESWERFNKSLNNQRLFQTILSKVTKFEEKHQFGQKLLLNEEININAEEMTQQLLAQLASSFNNPTTRKSIENFFRENFRLYLKMMQSHLSKPLQEIHDLAINLIWFDFGYRIVQLLFKGKRTKEIIKLFSLDYEESHRKMAYRNWQEKRLNIIFVQYRDIYLDELKSTHSNLSEVLNGFQYENSEISQRFPSVDKDDKLHQPKEKINQFLRSATFVQAPKIAKALYWHLVSKINYLDQDSHDLVINFIRSQFGVKIAAVVSEGENTKAILDSWEIDYKQSRADKIYKTWQDKRSSTTPAESKPSSYASEKLTAPTSTYKFCTLSSLPRAVPGKTPDSLINTSSFPDLGLLNG